MMDYFQNLVSNSTCADTQRLKARKVAKKARKAAAQTHSNGAMAPPRYERRDITRGGEFEAYPRLAADVVSFSEAASPTPDESARRRAALQVVTTAAGAYTRSI
jgi:hypothetical protein